MVVSAFVQSAQAWLTKFGIAAPDIRIEGLTLDSRQVSTKLAFVAIKGHTQDGRDFIPQAISLGTKLILCQTDKSEEHGKMEMRDHTVIVQFHRLGETLSALAAAFYDYPSNKMDTIAVTGTNGKTSVVQLLSQIKSSLGYRSAAIGTLGSGIYEGQDTQWSQTEAANTTPDAILMQYLMADFVQHDVSQVAFEASSHALVQGRLNQVNTDIAIFTNLSRDHLDYHGDMENYAAAKRLLIQQPGLRTLILNQDDNESERWRAHVLPGQNVVWTGLSESVNPVPQDRHCFATSVEYLDDGARFYLETSWGAGWVRTQLIGRFNIANLLCASAALLAQGVRFEDLINVLSNVTPVAGRMEMFVMKQRANVVVDFAHTPDALTEALTALRKHTTGKLYCIFGCGGDRDVGKRPLMGKAAEIGADSVVITTDNSRSETPESIANDILDGMQFPQQVICEPDRETAIRQCLSSASPGDLILVAGKGHEDYQIILGQRNNYNEREVVARMQQELCQ